jgi:hypothetical protein
VPPVVADSHDHIVDDEVDVSDDVVGLLIGEVVLAIGLQLLQNELVEQQLVQPIKLGEVVEDGLAVCCENDGVSDQVDDVLAVGDAAELEVGLQDKHILVVLEQAVSLSLIVVEAQLDD